MKKTLQAFAALAGLFSAACYADGFDVRDITNTVGQVSKILTGSPTGQKQHDYVAGGTRVKLEDGRIAEVYGFECAPRESQPCSSIRVDNSSHRILISPTNGDNPFEERWTFRKLQNGNLVFRRPKGAYVTAAQE